MKIRFKTDFANNWKAGDIADANYLDNGDVLVDGIASIDARLLFEACEFVDDEQADCMEEECPFYGSHVCYRTYPIKEESVMGKLSMKTRLRCQYSYGSEDTPHLMCEVRNAICDGTFWDCCRWDMSHGEVLSALAEVEDEQQEVRHEI